MKSFKSTLLATFSIAALSGCTSETYVIDRPGNPDVPPQQTVDPEKPECQTECTIGAKKCSNNAVWTCEKDDQNCLKWTMSSACPSGTHCNAENFKCDQGCSEICAPANNLRCNGLELERCQPDENECADWAVVEHCSSACDENAGKCITQCSNLCEAGAQKCLDNNIYECSDADGDGCTEWNPHSECTSSQECKIADDGSASCSNNCTSECTAGQKLPLANGYQNCVEAGNGCMKWGDPAYCNPGEQFDTASESCKPVCGDNCAPFSIVFLPDTQEYTRGDTKVLEAELKWIHDNYQSKNIVAVTHLGDMTDTNDKVAWEANDKLYAKYMDSIDLPYLVGSGNHDFLKCDSNSSAVATCSYGRSNSNMSKYGKFNNDRFKGKSWFGGFYSGTNSYMTITASGIKFLIISLEFAPRKQTICWAEDLIAKHPDHKVIVTTHAYLSSRADNASRKSERYTSGYTAGSQTDELPTGASGFELFQELASRHNNIILMASGHILSASTFRINKGFDGNWFNEMIVDYQEEFPPSGACSHSHTNGGSGGGWFRMLTFDPANRTITASTPNAMPKSYFKNSDVRFFCTADGEYPSDPNKMPAQSLTTQDPSFTLTTNHSFVVDYDFVTPTTYKATDGQTGFTHMNVNAISDGNQNNPAVAMNRKTRNFVAVWADDAYDSNGNDTDGANNQDIRARVFCETGCSKVAQFTVNTTTAGNQTAPDVAMDIDGNFVVVWKNGQDNSIYMRKFNIDGKQLIAETQVSTSGKADNPAVAIADDGSFVVTWQSDDLYMRGFDANGNQTFAQQKVWTTALQTGGKRALPDIGMAADGAFVITWEDDTDGNGYYEIYARGFNKDGSERIKQFKVNSDSANQQRDPAIGMNSSGDFYIAWEDDTDGNEVYRIRTRGFNKDGSQSRADTFVSAAGESATDPTVCMSAKGTAYFGWAAKEFKSDNNTFKNVGVTSSSADFSKESLISPITSGIEDQPAVACAENGNHVFLWHDDLDGNGYYEIMGKGF